MEITAFAPPAEAHARVAFALSEIRKYLIPDSNDEIRQDQMREMEMMAANSGDNVAAAMAAAAAAVQEPMKRAAALSAAASFRNVAHLLNPTQMHYPAAAAPYGAAGQGAAQQQPSQQQQPQQQHVRLAAVNGLPAAAAAGAATAALGARLPSLSSPYLAAAAGTPLVRGMMPQMQHVAAAAGQPQQQPQQKLYNEELLLEAAAVSQAPVELNKDGSRYGGENNNRISQLVSPSHSINKPASCNL